MFHEVWCCLTYYNPCNTHSNIDKVHTVNIYIYIPLFCNFQISETNNTRATNLDFLERIGLSGCYRLCSCSLNNLSGPYNGFTTPPFTFLKTEKHLDLIFKTKKWIPVRLCIFIAKFYTFVTILDPPPLQYLSIFSELINYSSWTSPY